VPRHCVSAFDLFEDEAAGPQVVRVISQPVYLEAHAHQVARIAEVIFRGASPAAAATFGVPRSRQLHAAQGARHSDAPSLGDFATIDDAGQVRRVPRAMWMLGDEREDVSLDVSCTTTHGVRSEHLKCGDTFASPVTVHHTSVTNVTGRNCLKKCGGSQKKVLSNWCTRLSSGVPRSFVMFEHDGVVVATMP